MCNCIERIEKELSKEKVGLGTILISSKIQSLYKGEPLKEYTYSNVRIISEGLAYDEKTPQQYQFQDIVQHEYCPFCGEKYQ
jgi:hypothetical protein